MADKETGAMAKFGPSAPAGSQTAGLVLLYADAFRTLPAVFLLSRGTNGPLVDGRRVTEARLEHGQEVRIGDAIFKFVDRDAELFGRYRIDGALSAGAVRMAHDVSELVGG